MPPARPSPRPELSRGLQLSGLQEGMGGGPVLVSRITQQGRNLQVQSSLSGLLSSLFFLGLSVVSPNTLNFHFLLHQFILHTKDARFCKSSVAEETACWQSPSH